MSSRHPNKPFALSGDIWKQLDPYQQKAVRFALRVKTAGLFFEQGTGKTWISGGLIEQLAAGASTTFSALLVVPLTNLETTWVKMLRKLDVRVCRTVEAFKKSSGNRVLVIHYEVLPAIIKKLKRIAWTLIAFDEAQRLKNRTSRTSKLAGQLHDCAQYKLILSGTPIEEQPIDLWAQFRFLNNCPLGSWKAFEHAFLEPINIDLSKYRPGSMQYLRMLRVLQIKRGQRKFDFEKVDEFVLRLSPYVLRVTKDVLDLPPLDYRHEPVTMRGKHRRVYDSMRDDLVSRLPRGVVSAPLKVTQMGKLQQICGGFVFDDEGQTHLVGRAKLRRAKKIIRQERLPIVIFCRYRQEVDALQTEVSRMVKRVEVLTGKVRPADRAIIQKDFQAGRVDVLICQIRTGGVGIDLFRSCVAIVYSTTYSFIDFEQAISRIHRRGQTRKVRIFLLYCKNTIDEVILKAILSKRRLINQVLVNFKGEIHGKGRRKESREAPGRVRVYRGRPRERTRHPADKRTRLAA